MLASKRIKAMSRVRACICRHCVMYSIHMEAVYIQFSVWICLCACVYCTRMTYERYKWGCITCVCVWANIKMTEAYRKASVCFDDGHRRVSGDAAVYFNSIHYVDTLYAYEWIYVESLSLYLHALFCSMANFKNGNGIMQTCRHILNIIVYNTHTDRHIHTLANILLYTHLHVCIVLYVALCCIQDWEGAVLEQ
jgi:hypothetical protein